MVLLGSLVFGEVTWSLGERFATFQGYLYLTLVDDGSTSGTTYPVTASRRGRLNSSAVIICLQISTGHIAGTMQLEGIWLECVWVPAVLLFCHQYAWREDRQ